MTQSIAWSLCDSWASCYTSYNSCVPDFVEIYEKISYMHHPVSGINSLIHSVSLASHVSTHLLIHLSAHLYYHHSRHHPPLLHSFTQCSKPTFSTNPSHLNTSSILDCLMIMGLDQTYHASRFIFRSFFSLILFVCSVWWTKLATGQLFTPHSIVS